MMRRKTRKLEETIKNIPSPLELTSRIDKLERTLIPSPLELTSRIDKLERTLTQLENDFLTLSEEIHQHITVSNVMRERAKKAKTPKEST